MKAMPVQDPNPWVAIQSARRLALRVTLGGLVLGGVLFAALWVWQQRAATLFGPLIGIVWIYTVVVFGGRVQTEPCPGCGRQWGIGPRYNSPFTNRCGHCGTSMGEPVPNAHQSAAS